MQQNWLQKVPQRAFRLYGKDSRFPGGGCGNKVLLTQVGQEGVARSFLADCGGWPVSGVNLYMVR